MDDRPVINLTAVPLFPFGRLLCTPGAAALGVDLIAYINRHLSGDWGEMDPSDLRENEFALKRGGLRLFSAYNLPDDDGRVWIITEADRSATTILLPEEY